MTEEQLAAQVEGLRDDEEAWGEPTQEPKSRRKSERRQRAAMVSVRFSPEELETVQAKAADAGATVSGYLRSLALAAADQRTSTMTWTGVAAINLASTSERLLVRSYEDTSPWLAGSGAVHER